MVLDSSPTDLVIFYLLIVYSLCNTSLAHRSLKRGKKIPISGHSKDPASFMIGIRVINITIYIFFLKISSKVLKNYVESKLQQQYSIEVSYSEFISSLKR